MLAGLAGRQQDAAQEWTTAARGALSTTDPRVDAYIAKAADFAQPILRHLRAVVHSACPGVEETVRWGFPHFDYEGVMCSMAAFKGHCTFGFWIPEVVPADGGPEEKAMGQFGRITRISDLPSKRVLSGYVKKAMALKDSGAPARPPRKSARPRAALEIPEDLDAALGAHATARTAFEAFSPSHRREYLEWIEEAKRAETRARRIAQAVAWLAEGKSRNWKYTR